MRNRLWLRFHLWTIGLLSVLTVANVISARRPFASNISTSAINHRVLMAVRAPASMTELPDGPPTKLKLAQLGCESSLRLKVANDIRQVRLQFDTCSMNDIVAVMNKTNGFEATVFGGEPKKAEPPAEMAGTFLMADDGLKKTTTRTAASVTKPKSPVAPPASYSTDYISLAPGENEIHIHRSGMDQTLKIERK